MKKLENYKRVAVVNMNGKPYHFAVYEDGNDYKAGDTVLLSRNNGLKTLDDVISLEEFNSRYGEYALSAEVITKVDITEFQTRQRQRSEKEKLKKELNRRKREIQEKMDNEYYAEKDPIYAEMLKQYESM